MKERPISYSPPMVRARRAGLKTQTRRGMRVQPDHVSGGVPFGDPPAWALRDGAASGSAVMRCPYGKIGDQLWIKEEHYLFGIWRIDGRLASGKPKYRFKADRSMGVLFDEEPNGLVMGRNTEVPGWYKRTSMFMPRWASRGLDEIVGIRADRLQSISEADAIAEGIHWNEVSEATRWCRTPVTVYRDLWESINGPGSWEPNPFVWVVEFKVINP